MSVGLRSFREAQRKTRRTYTQSEQYHTIVEIRDSYRPFVGYFSHFLTMPSRLADVGLSSNTSPRTKYTICWILFDICLRD